MRYAKNMKQANKIQIRFEANKFFKRIWRTLVGRLRGGRSERGEGGEMEGGGRATAEYSPLY